jgi:ribonuclease HI
MLRGLAMDLAIHKMRFDILNNKKQGSNSSADKTKNRNFRSKKKVKASGAKYYLNRRTYAF